MLFDLNRKLNMKLNSKTIVPSALLTAILALLTATFPGTATAATTVLTGGTEGLYSTYDYIGGYIYGMDFKSITAQSINALGFWDSGANGLGTGISYTVGLWDTLLPGSPLATVTISDADALDTSLTVEGGQWRYETIPTVNLTSGRTYTIGFYNPSDMSSADSLFLDYTSVTTASTVSKINNYRDQPGSALTFPVPTNPEFPVAQVNARFVPEPGSAGLVTLGCLMLLGRRRKTKD